MEKKASEVAAMGGDARARNLTRAQRQAISRKGALARWEKAGKPAIPKALRAAPLTIAGIEFDCAVLDDANNTRVVSETKFMAAMGMYRSGALSTRRTETENSAKMPLSLAYKNLKPFIDQHLDSVHFSPLSYRTPEGALVTVGLPASIIPKICEVWIDADRKGVLGKRQKLIAAKADMLHRGLAHVGIIGLIDEATGFQYDRPRHDLEEHLKKYLSESLRRWVRTFPADYFKHLCRLRNVELRTDMKLPSYFGHLTRDIVYRRIAPGLLKKLEERRMALGKPSNRLHQWTSEDLGYPELLIHLGTVVGLMKIHTNYDKFKKQLDAVAPVYPEVPGLFDDRADWE